MDERLYGREMDAMTARRQKAATEATNKYRTTTAADTAKYREETLKRQGLSDQMNLYGKLLTSYNQMVGNSLPNAEIPAFEQYAAPALQQFNIQQKGAPQSDDISQMSTDDLMKIVGGEVEEDFMPAVNDRESEYLKKSVQQDQPVFPKSVGSADPQNYLFSAGGTKYGFNPGALGNISLADILSQLLQSGQNIQYDAAGKRIKGPIPNTVSGVSSLYGSTQNSMR